MDQNQFETALDSLIAAYGRKVTAEIDAASCGTRFDWRKAHQASDAYQEARDAFIAEVFASPPAAPASPRA